MKEIQRQVFRELGKQMEQRLSFENYLATTLFGNHIITDMERKTIELKNLPEHKTRELLRILCTKESTKYDVFEVFCKVLEEDEQEYLAEMLRNKLQELETKQNGRPGASLQNSNAALCKRKQEDKAARSPSSTSAKRDCHRVEEDEKEESEDEGIDIPDGSDVTVKVQLSSEDLYFETYTSKKVYDMKGPQKGTALIINIKEIKGQETREGTQYDCENLKELWQQLGFKVITFVELDAVEIEEKVKMFAELPTLKEAKCAIVCILSHGKNGLVYGVDGLTVKIADLLKYLDNKNCPALQNKPKLWFFQACRGNLTDSGVEFEDASDDTVADSAACAPTSHEFSWWQGHTFEGIDDGTSASDKDAADEVKQQATLTDYLVAYPSPAGYKAWRNKAKGSWFIQAIVKVFQEHAATTDLCAMMNEVNRLVSGYIANKGGLNLETRDKSQMPEYVCRLRKMHLFFYPGI